MEHRFQHRDIGGYVENLVVIEAVEQIGECGLDGAERLFNLNFGSANIFGFYRLRIEFSVSVQQLERSWQIVAQEFFDLGKFLRALLYTGENFSRDFGEPVDLPRSICLEISSPGIRSFASLICLR